MKLTQDRDVFVNGHKNYKDTKKAERAAFYDFCAKFEGDALPLPQELAEAFNVTPNTIRIWAGEVGVPYPLRGIDSARMYLDRAVKYLQALQGTTTVSDLLKGAKLSYYAYDYYDIRNRLQKYYPELIAKIKATNAGRPIGKAGSSQKKGTSYYETQRARVLAALKVNPSGGCLNAARLLNLSLSIVTKHARFLIDEELVPESVLRVDARRFNAAYAKWLEDWEQAPDEVKTIARDDACYMYGVEIADIATFEFRSGFYLDYHKRELNALNEGAGRDAIRIAEALADALDRKVTFKELAIASRIAEPSLRRFALSLFGSRLTQFVDFNAPADAPPALSCDGDFVEGAGNFDAPTEWRKAVTERGHLGVNLTGGYFRRYLVMYLHRLRGMTFKAGKFVPLATPKARKGAILD